MVQERGKRLSMCSAYGFCFLKGNGGKEEVRS